MKVSAALVLLCAILASPLAYSQGWTPPNPCQSGWRDGHPCADSPQQAETPVQSMLRWSPGQWNWAVKICEPKKFKATESDGVPCSTVNAMKALCESSNAGARSKQQCEQWGFEYRAVAKSQVVDEQRWDAKALEVARDLATAAIDVDPNPGRIGHAEGLMKILGPVFLKQAVAHGMGAGCAKLWDAVSQDLNTIKSGTAAAAGSVAVLEMLGDAAPSIFSAVALTHRNFCSTYKVEISLGNKVDPRGLANCTADQEKNDLQSLTKFANLALQEFGNKYSCRGGKR